MTESHIQYEWTLKTLRNSNNLKSVGCMLEAGELVCIFRVVFKSVLILSDNRHSLWTVPAISFSTFQLQAPKYQYRTVKCLNYQTLHFISQSAKCHRRLCKRILVNCCRFLSCCLNWQSNVSVAGNLRNVNRTSLPVSCPVFCFIPRTHIKFCNFIPTT